MRYSQGNLRKRLRREDVGEVSRCNTSSKDQKGKGGEREMVSDSWQGCDDVENQRDEIGRLSLERRSKANRDQKYRQHDDHKQPRPPG